MKIGQRVLWKGAPYVVTVRAPDYYKAFNLLTGETITFWAGHIA